MRGYTIFDHAQLGHDEPTQRRVKQPVKPKPVAPRVQLPFALGTKWFSGLGVGPQFQKGRKP